MTNKDMKQKNMTDVKPELPQWSQTNAITGEDFDPERMFAHLAFKFRDWAAAQEFDPGEFPDPCVYMFNPGSVLAALNVPTEMWPQKTAHEGIEAAAREYKSLAVAVYCVAGEMGVDIGGGGVEFLVATLQWKTGENQTMFFPMTRVGRKYTFDEPVFHQNHARPMKW